MRAKNISGQAPGGKRTPLADVLPLPTPYVVQVFPIYACNLACRYCIFSAEPDARGFISDKKIMEMSLYRKCIDDLSSFPLKVKVLRIVGIGEPLLHREIAEMIRYARKQNVANTVELLTNGTLLTPANCDALIDAGLNRMVVSAQGTSADKYREVCGREINFDEFLNNLQYLYSRRGAMDIYIKIVDCALDGPEDEKLFLTLFGDCCDTIAVEHAVPIHHGVNYSKILKDGQPQKTQFGLPVGKITVCPQPFFTMQINPDGNLVPCYSFEYPEIIGNAYNESLLELWNGKKFHAFRRKMLDGVGHVCDACAECQISRYRLFPEDDLTIHAERLKPFFE